MMIIKRCLTLLALMVCFAALSYAQALPPDGGVGGHAPARSQLVTSDSFSLTGSSCMPVSTSPDCSAFPSGVQEVFSFYNQSGNPFNSVSITLNFDAADGGDSVGCQLMNIEPTWTQSNCLTGVPIPIGGGSVTLTFQQGIGGEGVGCYDANTTGTDLPFGNANQACLNNSVTAINNDIASGGTAQDPYVYYYPPLGINQVPPPVQTSGACTVPPNSGFPINTVLPWLVCGQNSWILGIGLTAPAGTPPDTFGYGTFKDVPITADVTANYTPEPPTLLLVGAAMLGISMLIMKKKSVHA